MEAISENDTRYLLAAYASEESPLIELIWEFEKWDCEKDTILQLLGNLLEDAIVGVTKLNSDKFVDLDSDDSLKFVRTWEDLNDRNHILYMTEKGFKLWDNDDWGITTDRARHLMLSNSGNVVRVDGNS